MGGRHRVFCDMDGTVATWNSASSYEELMEKGYFRKLAAMPNMLKAIRLLLNDCRYEVFALSAVIRESQYALREKDEWLDEHIPALDDEHRIFVNCGEDKASCVPGGIQPGDILLDDYSINLHQWSQHNGIAVKVLNGINGTKGTWAARQGLCVSNDWHPRRIKAQIDKITEGEM